MTPLPTTLVTGFLGSGKTTIISNLIDELQARGEQVVYLKNEIGSLNIDAQLLANQNIHTTELLNGCICCTLVGPFLNAIQDIIEQYHPDRLIIEASGAADPSAIALSISSTPGLYRDAVLGVIDVVNFTGYQDLSVTAQRQAHFTDILIFNKIEQADEAQKRAVVGYVRELNPKAPILEAPQGRVSATLVTGVPPDNLQAETSFPNHSDHDHSSPNHLELDGLSTCTIQVPPHCSPEKLQAWATHLPKTVFRVKGWWQPTTDSPVLLVNKVGLRTEIIPLPATESATTSTASSSSTNLGRLVCIGFNIGELGPQLERQLLAINTATT